VDDEMQRRVARLELVVLGENGSPGLSERMRRIEAWQAKQDKRTARLEQHAEVTEGHTHEIVGGWRVAKWFLIFGLPAIFSALMWLSNRLDQLAKAAGS
jgi:hypothetical protein